MSGSNGSSKGVTQHQGFLQFSSKHLTKCLPSRHQLFRSTDCSPKAKHIANVATAAR